MIANCSLFSQGAASTGDKLALLKARSSARAAQAQMAAQERRQQHEAMQQPQGYSPQHETHYQTQVCCEIQRLRFWSVALSSAHKGVVAADCAVFSAAFLRISPE